MIFLLLTILNMGLNRMKVVLKHLIEDGMPPNAKKSGGRKSNKRYHNTNDIERAEQFVQNYAATHG